MAEDLRNYNLQLQQVSHVVFVCHACKSYLILASYLNLSFLFQVEAALLTDPQNEELLKLKTDLEEVIELTKDLIKTQEGEHKVPNIQGSSNDDDVTASLLAAEEAEALDRHRAQWQTGQKCLAKWKADGM